MGPPTAAQRLELLDEQMAAMHASIRVTVTEEVSAAIKGVVAAMEQALSNRVIQTFEETLKRQDAKIDETTTRLEGRISRSREH